MTEDQLVRRLGAFGVGQDEARLYLHLCRLGAARVSQVARAAGLPRPRAYKAARSLEARGMAARTMQRPAQYRPLAVQEVLQRLLNVQQEHVKGLQHETQALEKDWPKAAPELNKPSSRFGVYQGIAQIVGLLRRTIAGSRYQMVGVFSGREWSRLYDETLHQLLLATAARGVEVKLLLEIDGPGAQRLKALEPSCQVRHLEGGSRFHGVITDGQQALFVVSLEHRMGREEAETALGVQSADFVEAQRESFELAWSQSIGLQERLAEVQSGPLAERAELVRGRWMRFNKMLAMFGRARRRVLVALPANDLDLWHQAGVLAEIKRLESERIVVLIQPQHAPQSPEAELQRGLALAGVVVDESEALLVFGADLDPGVRVTEREWSLWSSQRSQVQRLASEFERLGSAELQLPAILTRNSRIDKGRQIASERPQ